MKTRTVLWVASAALLVGALEAQEKDGKGAAAAAEVAAQSPEAKKLEALEERFNKKRGEVIAAYRKATTDDEKQKILAGMPGKDFIPEFRALAEEAKGTDTAVQAWLWVLNLVDDDPKEAWKVVQTLLEEYMESPALERLPNHLRYAAEDQGESNVVEALRAMINESPHERVQAGALFTLGSVLFDSKEDSNKAEGRKCFERVVSQYGSVPRGESSTYKVAAEAFLFELDHLQIGMAAPDFETVDENGASWRLSDYRGKVVVVDFWGNW